VAHFFFGDCLREDILADSFFGFGAARVTVSMAFSNRSQASGTVSMSSDLGFLGDFAMADPLGDAKIRLEWAKGQIRDLEVAVSNFATSKSYKIVIDTQSKPGYEIHKMFPAAEIPKDFLKMVSRAAQDLKSALDYAVYAVALHEGTDDDRIMFPIGKTREAFEHQMKHLKIERTSADLANLIRSIHPHKGGNDLLFALHQINRGDKHRKLAIVGMVSRVAEWGLDAGVIGEMRFAPPSPTGWHFLKDGFTVLELLGVGVKGKIGLAVNVTLSEIEGFEGEPIIAIFEKMTRAVEGFLLLVEDRFFR
jgi:hypothetical protein